jgi:uncharacterized protein
MPVAQLPVPNAQIADFSKRWDITELAFFGSVLRDDFSPDSDVDILVSFAPATHIGLIELVTIQEELQEILGRKVDLVTRHSVEQSWNYIRRKSILDSLEVIYAA